MRREETIGQWLGLLLALVLLLALMVCSGCASTTCKALFPKNCNQTTPEVTYVGVYQPQPQLPQPERPEKATAEADPEDWRAVLTAMGGDLLACWSWGEHLYSIIEGYNMSAASMPTGTVPLDPADLPPP